MARTFNLGRLSSILSLNSTDFRRDLSGSENQVRDFRRSLILLDRSMRDVNQRARAFGASAVRFGGAFGIAGGAGIGLFAREAAEAGTAIEELSLATGIAVPILDRLTRAFEGDGVAAKNSELAIRNFARRVGEAQQGMGTYIRALEAAGISQEELANTDLGTLLLRFISGLQGIEDASLRAAIAGQFFERAGLQLLATLSRSSEEFDLLLRRTQEFGTISDDTAGNLKDLDQSFTDLRQSVSIFSQNLTGAFAPRISDIITGFAADISDMEFEFSELSGTLRTVLILVTALGSALAGGAIVGGFVRLTRPLTNLVRNFRAARNAGKEVGASLVVTGQQGGRSLANIAAAGGAAALGLNELFDFFGALGDWEEEGRRIREEYSGAQNAAAAFAQTAADGMDGVADATMRARLDVEALNRSMSAERAESFSQAAEQIQRDAERRLRDAGLTAPQRSAQQAQDTILDMFYQQRDELVQQVADAEADVQRLARDASVDALSAEFLNAVDLVGLLERQLEQLDRQKGTIEGLALSMEGFVLETEESIAAQQRAVALADSARNALGGIFTAAATGAQSFGDILNNVVQRLKALAVEALLVRPILNALFGQPGQGGGLLGGFFQGLAGGAGGGLLGGLGSFLGFGAAAPALAAPKALGLRPDFLRNGLTLQFAPVIQGSDAATVSRALNQAMPVVISQAKSSIIADLEGPTRLRRAVRGI